MPGAATRRTGGVVARMLCRHLATTFGYMIGYKTAKSGDRRDHRSALGSDETWWAGWASTVPNEPVFTTLLEQIKATHRFRVAA